MGIVALWLLIVELWRSVEIRRADRAIAEILARTRRN